MDRDLPRPGWYWDPQELAFNTALRQRWRSSVMVLSPENTYRLRRWDGAQWTADTLRTYQARGLSSLPYWVGPETRLHPLTPAMARRGLRIWLVAMTLGSLVALLCAVVR